MAQWLNPSTVIKEYSVLVKGVKGEDGKFHVNLKEDGGEVFSLQTTSKINSKREEVVVQLMGKIRCHIIVAGVHLANIFAELE